MNKNMNNDIFNENSVSREESQNDFALSDNAQIIRPVSMASIAMCQRIGNKTLNSILNNEHINTADMNDFLTFIWMHVADPELVTYCVINYPTKPEILQNEVLLFGMNITPDMCLELLKAINRGQAEYSEQSN
jgi:hypothetical protein